MRAVARDCGRVRVRASVCVHYRVRVYVRMCVQAYGGAPVHQSVGLCARTCACAPVRALARVITSSLTCALVIVCVGVHKYVRVHRPKGDSAGDRACVCAHEKRTTQQEMMLWVCVRAGTSVRASVHAQECDASVRGGARQIAQKQMRDALRAVREC